MKPKRTKPDKPRKDFPLTAHPGGSWCKKVRGKLFYFGPWSDPEGAEKQWEEFQRAERTGQSVRATASGSMLLRDVSNLFLTHHNRRAVNGDINVRTFRDLNAVIELFAKSAGSATRIGDIGTDHFSAFRESLTARNLGGAAINRTITLVKQLFKWAYEEDCIEKPMKYGQSLAKVSAATMRKTRKAKDFAPAEVRKMLAASHGPMKAFILLAINCGFGNNDLGALNEADVNLAKGFIDYARTKTGERRRCPLWPETIKAMKAVAKDRPEPAGDADAGAFFLTVFGRRFVRAENRLKDGRIVGQTVVDSVSTLFYRMMKTAGVWADPDRSDGRNFYTLRRTHRTWADECGDPHAAALIMGHGTGTIARLYVQRIDDARLIAVSKHVRAKLFKK